MKFLLESKIFRLMIFEGDKLIFVIYCNDFFAFNAPVTLSLLISGPNAVFYLQQLQRDLLPPFVIVVVDVVVVVVVVAVLLP